MIITNWIGSLFIIAVFSGLGLLAGQINGYKQASNIAVNLLLKETTVEVKKEIIEK